jgi:hypothetical protein
MGLTSNNFGGGVRKEIRSSVPSCNRELVKLDGIYGCIPIPESTKISLSREEETSSLGKVFVVYRSVPLCKGFEADRVIFV